MPKTFEDYDESRTDLLVTLDIDNLEFEVGKLSRIVHDYGVYKAYANYELSMAKAKLERHKAELSATVRVTPSEYGVGPPNLNDAIKEYVICNAETIRLENDVIDKKLILDKITSACDGLAAKGFSLSWAIKLWSQNYYADNPISGEQKRALEGVDYEEAYEKMNEIMTQRRKSNES